MTVDEVLQKIKNENIKTVIFDFDNTICDLNISWDKWDEEVGELMKSYDQEAPMTGGYMRDNRINAFIEKYGEDFINKWRDLSNNYEEKNATSCNPKENMMNLIEKLDGIEKWIWSSNSENTVKKYLSELGIIHLFSKFITRDSVNFIKPNPDGFTKTAGENANKSKYIFIGNSENDKNAASNAGIQYIDEKDIEV